MTNPTLATGGTRDQPTTDTPTTNSQTVTPTRKSAEGLDIAALITAIFVAPVGMILGIVLLVRGRREANRASILAIIATWIGAAGTVLVIMAIVVSLLVVKGIGTASDTAAFCARAAADPTLLDDIKTAGPVLLKLTGPIIPNRGPSADEKQAAIDTATKLQERIDVIALYEGSSYPTAWGDWTDLYEQLRSAKESLKNGGTATFSIDSSQIQNAKDDMQKLCSH